MIQQLNPCDAQAWLKIFVEDSFYKEKITAYNHVIASHQEASLLKAALHTTVYAGTRSVADHFGIVDAVPHYYIQYLREKNPKIIADIGCGNNEFKKIYPNIVGIDADPNSNYDQFDHFDLEFCAGHKENYDAVITINAIHFAPIDSIAQRTQMIADLVKPGGRAFVSTNLETWLMYTDQSSVIKLFGKFPNLNTVMNYVHEQIMSTGLNFLVIDYPVLSYSKESTIRDDYNGNLRVVFEKC